MSEEEDEGCWSKLEHYRVKLISVIDPNRITPYLRQCRVLNSDDEEQVFNDPSLVIRKRKVGVLLDILQRTGYKGYDAFLESLELYYPHLYRKITGTEPSRVFSMIIDTAGESSLTQLLMNEMLKLQQTIQEERRKYKELNTQMVEKEATIRQLQVKDSELKKYQERVQKMKEERDNFNTELKKCKDEIYELAMKYAQLSEEKTNAVMRNRDLQLEIEKLKHNLMKAEDDCKLERKQTMKLKNAIEKRPSRDVIFELQRENELLKAKIQELDKPLQNLPKGETSEKTRLYIQDLEDERRQALEQYQDMVNTVYTLKMSLRQAEDLRDKYFEEREVSELHCTALKKHSKMYKDRIEAILQQMDEVSIERNMAIATREEFHAQYTKSLKDKDALRKQLRELGEKYDDLQIQLIRKEGKLLSLETKLKRTESPALLSTIIRVVESHLEQLTEQLTEEEQEVRNSDKENKERKHLEGKLKEKSSDADECSSRSSQEITALVSVCENKTQHDKDESNPLENGSDRGETSKTEENAHSPVNGGPVSKGRRRIKIFEDYRRIRALKSRNSQQNEECYSSESETDMTP